MNSTIEFIQDKVWSKEYWDNPNTDKLLQAQLNRYTDLILEEVLRQLQHSWLDIDTAPHLPDHTALDFAVKQGKKDGVVIAMHRIKKCFGIEK